MIRQACRRPTDFWFASKHEHQRPTQLLTTVLDNVCLVGWWGWGLSQTVIGRWGRSTVPVHVTTYLPFQWIPYLTCTLVIVESLYTCRVYMSAKHQAMSSHCLFCFWLCESNWGHLLWVRWHAFRMQSLCMCSLLFGYCTVHQYKLFLNTSKSGGRGQKNVSPGKTRICFFPPSGWKTFLSSLFLNQSSNTTDWTLPKPFVWILIWLDKNKGWLQKGVHPSTEQRQQGYSLDEPEESGLAITSWSFSCRTRTISPGSTPGAWSASPPKVIFCPCFMPLSTCTSRIFTSFTTFLPSHFLQRSFSLITSPVEEWHILKLQKK